MLSLAECTWATSNHGGLRRTSGKNNCCTRIGCCGNFAAAAGSTAELAMLVSSYRKYYHSLDYNQQRLWWEEHSDYKGYELFANDVPLKKGSRTHKTWVENYETMRTRLATANESEVLRPVPDSAFMPTCQKFLCFLVAGHHDTMDQHAIRKHAFAAPDGAMPEDLDASIPSARSQMNRGADPDGVRHDKTALVRLWLMDQGTLSLMDPGADHSILPYRSCAETHAHYVFSRESELGKPWASTVFEALLDARRGFRDEEKEDDDRADLSQENYVLHELQPEDEDAAAANEKLERKKKFRYGNRFCGKLDDSRPEDSRIASLSHFNRIWREDEELAKIICREHLPFAKCDFCIQHRAKKERKRTQEALDEDNMALREHLKDIRNEKLYYYSNRARGRRYPDEYLSIIIDGADQSKHDMPHFKDMSHLTNELRRIKMHLYGALVHGRGAYAFTITDHEAQGHNSSIQVLHHILVDVAKHGKMPRILKLQLDNTTKQNKGQYLFAYLNLLVEYGVFESVEVSYLPVGHTHEDIDQFFSRIAVWLRHHDCFDRTELACAIRQAFTFKDTLEPATVIHWDTIANLSQWLHSFTNNFAKHCMSYRHLRFFRSAKDKKVWLQGTSRMNSWGDTTDEWRGLAPLSTHTLCFPTSYGIPDIYEASKSGAIPDAQRRELNEFEHTKVVNGMHTIYNHFEHFTQDNLDDCLEMLQGYTQPSKALAWKKEDMKMLYGRGAGVGASSQVAAQQSLGLPVGEVGQIYLCQPEDLEEDPFIIGVIRGIVQLNGRNGVNMQWFALTEPGADKYKGTYSAILPANTRTNNYPFADDGCLQYELKGAKHRRNRNGVITSLRLHVNEISAVKHYEERFENGPDLQDRRYEQVLDQVDLI